jgi:hypothetical protein
MRRTAKYCNKSAQAKHRYSRKERYIKEFWYTEEPKSFDSHMLRCFTPCYYCNKWHVMDNWDARYCLSDIDDKYHTNFYCYECRYCIADSLYSPLVRTFYEHLAYLFD